MRRPKTVSAFEGLLSGYFERMLRDVPTFATIMAGLPSGEGELGSLSLEFQQRREKQRQAALKALENLSPRDLASEQQLDHLQFVTANSHPRKWRHLFAHAVFYEGWSLWCERMLVALDIDRSPWTRIQQLHDSLWRCHRILIDLRLQTGRYTHEQAARHLQKQLGFTRARAEAEANWYTGQPGVPMSYWLGRLENDRLRKRLMAGRRWSLQQFNDWLLSFGTIPQGWIERYGLD